MTPPALIPQLEPLAAPQTKEERRERQRLHVKRTNYRKTGMQELRDTLRELEDEFARLSLLQQQQQTNQEDDKKGVAPRRVEHDSEGRADAEAPAPSKSLQQLTTDLFAVKARLRTENEALQVAITAHERYATKLTRWVDKGFGPAPSSSGDELVADNVRRSEPVRRAIRLPKLKVPFSVKTCTAIARDTYAGMRHFGGSHECQSTGASVFGWRDKRVRDGDRVAFSMKKVFRDISPLKLSSRGWAITGASSRLSLLYSSFMNVEVFTLQCVDDDNQIKLRVMASSDGRALIKTLFLVSRFAIADGYIIIIRSLDHTQYIEPTDAEEADGVSVQWGDYYNWTLFTRHGESENECLLEFGGEVKSNAVSGSDVWMLEVLLVALRWENLVVGPIFSIC